MKGHAYSKNENPNVNEAPVEQESISDFADNFSLYHAMNSATSAHFLAAATSLSGSASEIWIDDFKFHGDRFWGQIIKLR